MSREEVVTGQAWVIVELTALVAQRGLLMGVPEWIQTSKGFDEGFELLVVSIGDRTLRRRFRTTDLEDHATASVQRQLRVTIGQLLAAESPVDITQRSEEE